MDARTRLPVCLLGMALCACSNGSDPAPPTTRQTALGFTPWPYDATVAAVDFVYAEAAARGDFIAHHLDAGIPWNEALNGAPYPPAVDAEIATRLANTDPAQRAYLAISPFNTQRNGLAGYWSASANEPLPAPWSGYDFDSPEVIAAYTNFARDLIGSFQPTWFNLGIEASELALNDLARYDRFVTFATSVSATLRAEFPDTELLVSIALKSPGSPEAGVIEANLPRLVALVDVVGVSVYPYVFFDHADRGDPATLPADWLSQVHAISGGKPIAIAETGWIAEHLVIPAFGVDIPSNPAWQNAYVHTLLGAAEAEGAEFVVWFSLVDFDALWTNALGQDPLAAIWRDTGLFDEALVPRPALTTWQRHLDLPLR